MQQNRSSKTKAFREKWSILVVAFGLTLASIAAAQDTNGPGLVVSNIQIPAGAGSRFSNVSTADDGTVYVCWLEPAADKHYKLRFSALGENGLTTSRTIAEGSDWFVNWADFPSIVAGSGGRLAAHWLARMGRSTYAYGVRVSFSRDAGLNWSEPQWLHDDRTPNEHGFVSLVPDGERFIALWLDSRNMNATGKMAIWSRTIDAEGGLGDERLVDPDVCSCCQTSAVLSQDRVVAVYRDRTAEEIRDISITSRSRDARWTAPNSVHDDGWFVPS